MFEGLGRRVAMAKSKEATGGEFRVYRASIRLLLRYIDLL